MQQHWPAAGAAAGRFHPRHRRRGSRRRKHHGRVATRFPPEPNGYLHIGHAKSICLNFGIADERGGTCNLRFDDTNPTKEDVEYVDAIKEDVAWLGFEWDAELYASDYFEQLYQFAVQLIRARQGLRRQPSADEIRAYRGTLTEPGRNSPYRDRPVEENLDLFARMRAGEFPDGAHVLRAKIDMASPNLNMRDPTLYRIRHASHHRTGDAWCIYPMYDYAHPLSDAIERITHSLCTLEFEDHRPLYDWLVENLIEGDRPQQIEFARLNLNYTVMSKRKLLQLVQQGHVVGLGRSADADDQRPAAARLHARVDPRFLRADRRGEEGERHRRRAARAQRPRGSEPPRAAGDGRAAAAEGGASRTIPKGRSKRSTSSTTRRTRRRARARCRSRACSTSSRTTSCEDPPKKFFRLSPGSEVRLRCAYFITCTEVVKDEARRGRRAALHLRSGDPRRRRADGRRVKATLHWVSAAHAVPAEVRLYDRLFTSRIPTAWRTVERFSTTSTRTRSKCCAAARPSRASRAPSPGTRFQFERLGYFCVDPDSRPGRSSSTAPYRCATPGRASRRSPIPAARLVDQRQSLTFDACDVRGRGESATATACRPRAGRSDRRRRSGVRLFQSAARRGNVALSVRDLRSPGPLASTVTLTRVLLVSSPSLADSSSSYVPGALNVACVRAAADSRISPCRARSRPSSQPSAFRCGAGLRPPRCQRDSLALTAPR